MAKPILVANWKNYPNSLLEARTLLKDLTKKKKLFDKTNLYIAPPSPYLELVSKSFAKLASQDLFHLEKGSYTGFVGTPILKSFGVRLSILGHSERRAQGESSEEVKEKIKAALRAGIIPLVCVGEVTRDAEGEYFGFLQEQIKASLADLSKKEVKNIMIAYEPVWAIGKTAKDALNVEDLSQTVLFIKKVLSDLFGRDIAQEIPVLYGGSVEAKNAREHLVPGIKGFLVGHASLNSKNFIGIVESLLEK
jgi:triosephosphate isomerase (TIM)